MMRFSSKTASTVIPVALAAVCVASLTLWLRSTSGMTFYERAPSAKVEERPATATAAIVGSLTKSDGIPANLPGAWPRFRGANLDNISPERTPLSRSWPPEGPKALWSVTLGEGHAGAAVLDGCAYVFDYDQVERADALRCLSLADGRDIWRFSYPVEVKRNHGMSRTVPTVTERHVVGIGPKCHVICLDSKTGLLKWAIDLARQYGTKVPPWYAGQCPLIDGDRVILAPGGRFLMIAVDVESGATIWKTANLNAWQMTHSSIVPMRFSGKQTYVYCASGGVVGVNAVDGSVLWQTSEWRINIATVPTPVVVGDNRIFLTGGYNAGSMMLELKEEGGKVVPRVVFRLPATVFGCEQQTPILYKDHLYGVTAGGQLVCLSLEGKVLWASGPRNTFGLGPLLIADGMIYALNDNGLLSLAEADSTSYKQLAQAHVLQGHDSWGPMAIANGLLLVRDLTTMTCLDVRKH